MELRNEEVERLTLALEEARKECELAVAEAYQRGAEAMRGAVRRYCEEKAIPRVNFPGFFVPAMVCTVALELRDELERLSVPADRGGK